MAVNHTFEMFSETIKQPPSRNSDMERMLTKRNTLQKP
jgi:hypothetical protein